MGCTFFSLARVSFVLILQNLNQRGFLTLIDIKKKKKLEKYKSQIYNERY